MRASAIRELANRKPIEAKILLMQTIRDCNADLKVAAKSLNISRRTIYRLIKSLDLYAFWGEEVAKKARQSLTNNKECAG